jgi:hypothetical protein
MSWPLAFRRDGGQPVVRNVAGERRAVRVVRCRTPSGRHVLSGATAEAVGSDRTAPSRNPISGGITSKPTDATKLVRLYGGPVFVASRSRSVATAGREKGPVAEP